MPFDSDVLANLEATLDGLSDPTAEEAYDALLPYETPMVAAAAARRALGGGGGGSQPFVLVTLRHSADFSNLSGGAPALVLGSNQPKSALTLPPSLFGDGSIIDVLVYNGTAASVAVGGALVVQNAAGTVWIEQDTALDADTTIAAGASASIDFATNGGSGGAGLSWNAGTKQVELASAGVYSAFVSLYVLTA